MSCISHDRCAEAGCPSARRRPSDEERLQTMGLEAMSTARIRNTKKEIRRVTLPLDLSP
jgi:hypothetical protein